MRSFGATRQSQPTRWLPSPTICGPAILQEQSSVPEAILALKQAVYAEPQFVLGHFALGNLALKHGRIKESAKHFENVLLLLARYEPEDIVPESEGLSAAG